MRLLALFHHPLVVLLFHLVAVDPLLHVLTGGLGGKASAAAAVEGPDDVEPLRGFDYVTHLARLETEGNLLDRGVQATLLDISDVAPGARGPGKPRPLSLAKLKKAAQLDPRDAAVARCIEQRRYSASELRLDKAGAAIALIDHPGLVFDDAPEQAVALREALPLLEVLRERKDGGEHFAFHLADPNAKAYEISHVRSQTAPAFEDVKEQVKTFAQRKKLQAYLDELRKTAKIQKAS